VKFPGPTRHALADRLEQVKSACEERLDYKARAPRVGERRSHPVWGRGLADGAQTGQSEAIHSPDECASVVVRLTMPAAWSIAVVCMVAISCWPRVLRTISSPLERGA
jgi:hypothetical protein